MRGFVEVPPFGVFGSSLTVRAPPRVQCRGRLMGDAFQRCRG